MVELIYGSHNHDLAETLVGHIYAGRLSVEEKVMVEDMTKILVKPINILLTMKERNEKNVTRIKQFIMQLEFIEDHNEVTKQKCNNSCCYWSETYMCIGVGVKMCQMLCIGVGYY